MAALATGGSGQPPGPALCPAGSRAARRRHPHPGVLRLLALVPGTPRSAGPPPSSGFANYAKILGDSYFWRALGNTVAVVLVVVHVELVLGLAMALLFAGGLPLRKYPHRGRASALCGERSRRRRHVAHPVRSGYRPDDAVPQRHRIAAAGMGRDAEPRPRPRRAAERLAAPALHLHHPLRGPTRHSQGTLRGSARRRRQRLADIPPRDTCRCSCPAILVAMLFRYIFAYRLFSEVWLLTQGGPARSTEVVAVYLYLEAFRYNDFGAAAATGWIMVAHLAPPGLVLSAQALSGDVRPCRVTAHRPACRKPLRRRDPAPVLAVRPRVGGPRQGRRRHPRAPLVHRPDRHSSSSRRSRRSATSSRSGLRPAGGPTLENFVALWTPLGRLLRRAHQQPDRHRRRDRSRGAGLDTRRLRLLALAQPVPVGIGLRDDRAPPAAADRDHLAAVSDRQRARA